ncbi:MAG: DUF5106 domain-containing protein [Bacteroidales bacterium]|nr:DUF5106 domain-containing protein [Bacteroidales bacterium]
MRVFRQFSMILAAVILLASCGGKVKSPARRSFPPPPQVPSVVTDPQEIAGYVATHFWDAFLSGVYPCDSSLVNGVPADDVESAVGRFVTILETVCERPTAIKAMDGFFQKINDFQTKNPSSNVYGYFMRMVEKYLYDPNSPVRDEDLYLPYIKGLAGSDLTPEEMRPAYSRDALMCSLNQVGTNAADIRFTGLDGRVRTLYGIKADYVLLLFTNPGCPNCEEVISTLTGNDRFNNAITTGKIAVVNLYIDLEVDKWKGLASEYPKAWTNGYDQDYIIRKDLTYNVRAIPSLYLLDKDKKVILKDAPIEKVLPYLENI